MRRAQGTLGLVVPRDFPNGALGPSGRTAERSGSGLGSRDSELQPCGCGQKARRNPCATLLTRCRPLSLRPRCPCGWGARRRVRARRYLGPLRDSTSTGRPARRSRCSLGSWSRCSTNATCRAPPAPLGPAQWDGPRTLPLGERARARAGATLAAQLSPPLPRACGTTWITPSAREGEVEGGGAEFGHAHSIS